MILFIEFSHPGRCVHGQAVQIAIGDDVECYIIVFIIYDDLCFVCLIESSVFFPSLRSFSTVLPRQESRRLKKGPALLNMWGEK
jgi:hypothetical protein